MSAAAREHILQQFNEETMGARYEELFRALLKNRVE